MAMGRRDHHGNNVRNTVHILNSLDSPAKLQVLIDPPCAAGSGEKTSPTATMGGTRTVWSSGTMRPAMAVGMMRTVT